MTPGEGLEMGGEAEEKAARWMGQVPMQSVVSSEGVWTIQMPEGFLGGASPRKVPKPTRTTKRESSGRRRGHSLERIPSAKPHSTVILDSALTTVDL